MFETDSYFLLKDGYKNLPIGSLIYYDGKNLTHIQEDNDIMSDESFKKNLIRISSSNANACKMKNRLLRNELYKLKKGDTCLFIEGESKVNCTITKRIEEDFELYFMINIKGVKNQRKAYIGDIELPKNDFNDLYLQIKKKDGTESDEKALKEVIQFTHEDYNILKNVHDNIIIKDMREGDGKEEKMIIITTFMLKEFNNIMENRISKDIVNFDLSLISLKTILNISLNNSSFVVGKCDRMIEEMKRSFTILTKQEKNSENEENILIFILSIYWNLLKSGQRLNASFMETLKAYFQNMKYENKLRLGVSMCLSYLIDFRCPLLGEVYLFLKTVIRDTNIKTIEFTDNDITLALGKISLLVVPDYITSAKLKISFNAVSNLYNMETRKTFTPELHWHLTRIHRIISKMKFHVSDHFIKIMQLMLETFNESFDKSQDKPTKTMLDCVMTTLSIICDLCDSNPEFVEDIIHSSGLKYALTKIFMKVTKRSKPYSIYEQFLENVIFIYWNILKSKQNFVPDLKEHFESIYNNPKVNVQIKIAAALCLSSGDDLCSETIISIKLYLKGIYDKSKSDDIYGFPRSEISSGLINIASMEEIIDSSVYSNDIKRKKTEEETIIGTLINALNSIAEFDISKNVTNDAGKQLTELSVQFQNAREEFMKTFDCFLIINMISKVLADVYSWQSDEKLSSEQENILNCCEIIMKIVCDLCDSNIEFIKGMVGNNDFMIKLGLVLDKFGRKSKVETIEKQIIEHILFIFWNIYKFRLRFNYEMIKIELFERCFSKSNDDDPIKIMSALCLCCLYVKRSDKSENVKTYLINLRNAHTSREILGFPKCDIYTGLGYITSVKVFTSTEKEESEHTSPVFKSLEKPSSQESSLIKFSTPQTSNTSQISTGPVSTNREQLTLEDYKRIFLHFYRFLRDIDTIDGIKETLKMDDLSIAKHCIMHSKPPINLTDNNDILEQCISIDDKELLMALLSNCETSSGNYESLLQLIWNKYKNVDNKMVELACRKLKKDDITDDINQQLLAIAYYYASIEKKNMFKMFIDVCKNLNDFLKFKDESSVTETFLTNMIQHLNVSLIDMVWTHSKFDTNISNKAKKAPIILACQDSLKLKWLVDNKTKDFLPKDWYNANNAISATNPKREEMIDMLHKCKPK